MNYDAFLQAWNQALSAAGLNSPGMFPTQTVNLRSMDQTYQVFIPFGHSSGRYAPFYATVELSWRWEALLSARFATTEEDMVMEIYERREIYHDTASPWLRVDFAFHAGLQMDLYALPPSSDAWRKWASSVMSKIPPSFSDAFEDEEDDRTFSWLGEPNVQTTCSSSGQFYLNHVSLSGWKGIILPRQWDDPDRPPEENPSGHLVDLFTWLHENVQVWGDNLKVLSNEQKA
jgi:hypothetical protein